MGHPSFALIQHKKLAGKGIEYAKENPQEALGMLRQGVKLATGARNVPYQNSIVGGSPKMILGAGGGTLFKSRKAHISTYFLPVKEIEPKGHLLENILL